MIHVTVADTDMSYGFYVVPEDGNIFSRHTKTFVKLSVKFMTSSTILQGYSFVSFCMSNIFYGVV
jgi:hypothetical protein